MNGLTFAAEGASAVASFVWSYSHWIKVCLSLNCFNKVNLKIFRNKVYIKTVCSRKYP